MSDQRFSEDLIEELRNKSPDELDRLRASTDTLIERMDIRIQYAEGRRGGLAVLAGAFVAAGTALTTQLLATDISYQPGYWAMVVASVGLILVGLLTLIIFARQINYNLPFRALTTTWKWFYRDAVPRNKEFPAPWHTIQFSSQHYAFQELYNDQWRAFVERSLTLTDPAIDAAQNLEQVYVLHLNEYYKNRFLMILREVMVKGLVAVAAASVATFVLVRICH